MTIPVLINIATCNTHRSFYLVSEAPYSVLNNVVH